MPQICIHLTLRAVCLHLALANAYAVMFSEAVDSREYMQWRGIMTATQSQQEL